MKYHWYNRFHSKKGGDGLHIIQDLLFKTVCIYTQKNLFPQVPHSTRKTDSLARLKTGKPQCIILQLFFTNINVRLFIRIIVFSFTQLKCQVLDFIKSVHNFWYIKARWTLQCIYKYFFSFGKYSINVDVTFNTHTDDAPCETLPCATFSICVCLLGINNTENY